MMMVQPTLHFRSLGNALYPELAGGGLAGDADFRSLGNALYPEQKVADASVEEYFRSLGNALYLEHKKQADGY